ncbi:nucleotidyltransferase family protein [Segatella copri]|uniref:Nucleotidyltransferase domain-containing protein n=1 Tax=Segatella copri TaxID=165179 RepID=A0AAW5TWL6_9BACT|nr:nucleotidyltransferase domain-containing protein [Segatella copri]MCW4092675.1 nucleotidyltransferase domain-containing protein [Segatella copri]
MKSREYYISLITSHAEELKKNFGIKSLRLFGSVSRNEQKEGSDVDICVDITENVPCSKTETFSRKPAGMFC